MNLPCPKLRWNKHLKQILQKKSVVKQHTTAKNVQFCRTETAWSRQSMVCTLQKFSASGRFYWSHQSKTWVDKTRDLAEGGNIYIYIDSKENAPKIYRELEDELFLFFFSESRKCLGEAFPAAIERQHCPKITLLKLQESNGPRVMRDTCMSYAAMLQVHLHLFLTISKDISSNSTVSYQKKHGTQQRIL